MPNELKPCPDRVWVLNPTDPVTQWDMSESGAYHTDVEYTRTDTALLTKLKGLRDEMREDCKKYSPDYRIAIGAYNARLTALIEEAEHDAD